MVPGIVTITLEHCDEVKSEHKSMEETNRQLQFIRVTVPGTSALKGQRIVN